MKSKKSQLFLWISIVFFVASVIVSLIATISSYFEVVADFPNDPSMVSRETAGLVYMYMLFVFPVFALELSCIRSTYKILKYGLKGVVKFCYVISAFLAFSAFVFQCMIFFGVIDLVGNSGSLKLQETMLALTGWPIFIISFIIGSIKKNDKGIGKPASKSLWEK